MDPLSTSYPHYSPYHFAGNSPISNIDLDGLEPKNMVTESGRLTRSFIHLVSKVTGLEKTSLAQTSVEFSNNFHKYSTRYTSGGITIGVRIIFTEDYKDPSGFGNSVQGWMSILPHELGHRKQSDGNIAGPSGYLLRYGIQSLATAIKVGSLNNNVIHDEIPMEKEADESQIKFDNFVNHFNYTKKDGSSGNKVYELFDRGVKDQDKIMDEINKMLDEYNGNDPASRTKSENTLKH